MKNTLRIIIFAGLVSILSFGLLFEIPEKEPVVPNQASDNSIGITKGEMNLRILIDPLRWILLQYTIVD